MPPDESSHNRSRLSVKRLPVQNPHQPRLLRESRIEGHGLQTRMLIDLESLESMLDKAKHSMTNRCVLIGCDMVVRIYEEKGVQYEVWQVECEDIQPEMAKSSTFCLVTPR